MCDMLSDESTMPPRSSLSTFSCINIFCEGSDELYIYDRWTTVSMCHGKQQ